IGIYRECATPAAPPKLRMLTTTVKRPLRDHPIPDHAEAIACERRDELKRVQQHGTERQIRDATARATQAGMAGTCEAVYYGHTDILWPMSRASRLLKLLC